MNTCELDSVNQDVLYYVIFLGSTKSTLFFWAGLLLSVVKRVYKNTCRKIIFEPGFQYIT